jgi:hypothetical protein
LSEKWLPKNQRCLQELNCAALFPEQRGFQLS